MNDNNEILQAIGGIKVSVDVMTRDISSIKQKQDLQGEKLNELATSLELYKLHGTACKKEFSDINRKLEKDFITLNRLDKEAESLKTIASYKTNAVSKFKVFLGIIATVVGLLISINQLAGIKNKVSFKATPAVYATQLDTSRADTLDPFRIK